MIYDVLKAAGYERVFFSNDQTQLASLSYTFTSYFNTSAYSVIEIPYVVDSPGWYNIDWVLASVLLSISFNPCPSSINVTVEQSAEAAMSTTPHKNKYVYASQVTTVNTCSSSITFSFQAGGGERLPLPNDYSINYIPVTYPYIVLENDLELNVLGSQGSVYSIDVTVQPTYLEIWRYSPLVRTFNVLFYLMFAVVALHLVESLLGHVRHTKHEHS